MSLHRPHSRRPTPTSERTLVLVQVTGEAFGRRYPLGRHTVILGRDPSCDIPVQDRSVSRHHARIEPEDDGALLLVDNGSSNGTSVNGQPVTSRHLDLGDRITLGDGIELVLTQLSSLDEQLLLVQRQAARESALHEALERLTPLLEPASSEVQDVLLLLGRLAGRLGTEPEDVDLDTLFHALERQVDDERLLVDLEAGIVVNGCASDLLAALVALVEDGLSATRGPVRVTVQTLEVDPGSTDAGWVPEGGYARVQVDDSRTGRIDPDRPACQLAQGVLRAHGGLLMQTSVNGASVVLHLPLD